VREEHATNAKAAPSSDVMSPTPTISVNDADVADKGRSPNQAIGGSSSGGDEADLP
jgi:hypothetical protein